MKRKSPWAVRLTAGRTLDPFLSQLSPGSRLSTSDVPDQETGLEIHQLIIRKFYLLPTMGPGHDAILSANVTKDGNAPPPRSVIRGVPWRK